MELGTIWNDVLRKVKQFAKNPERFCQNDSSEDFERIKLLLKVLYDGTKMATCDWENAQTSLKTLHELIVDDFDEEQVWTGVELQNKSIAHNMFPNF